MGQYQGSARDSIAPTALRVAFSLFGMVTLSFAGVGTGAPSLEEAAGSLKNVIGKAKVLRDGKEIQATRGMPIFSSDTLVTEEKTAVKIQFKDGGSFLAFENSKFSIKEYSMKKDGATTKISSNISIDQGKARFVVKPKDGQKADIKFSTGNSVMGIRGTSGMIYVDKGTSSFAIDSGKVAIVPIANKDLLGSAFALADGKLKEDKTGVSFVPAGSMATVEGKNVTKLPMPAFALADMKNAEMVVQNDPAGNDSAAAAPKKEEKKDEKKSDDAAAKKDDGAAKKDDAGAKKDDAAAKKDDGAANKDAVKKEPAATDAKPAASGDAAPAKSTAKTVFNPGGSTGVAVSGGAEAGGVGSLSLSNVNQKNGAPSSGSISQNQSLSSSREIPNTTGGIDQTLRSVTGAVDGVNRATDTVNNAVVQQKAVEKAAQAASDTGTRKVKIIIPAGAGSGL